MPTVKLTDAAIQRFKARPGERVEYFDSSMPGFGLRVAGPTRRAPEGRRSWIIFYRFRGEQKRLTLGYYAEGSTSSDPKPDAADAGTPRRALGLKDARKEAGDILQIVARGIDPAAQRAEARELAAKERDTIASIVEKFLTSGMKGKKGRALSTRYLVDTRRIFNNHVIPRWEKRDLTSITRRDVTALIDAIAACEPATKGRSKARQEGGPIAANRTLAALRSMMNWCLRRGMIDANPCALVEPPGEETRRERILTAAEIQELWPLFAGAGHPFGDFFRVALLTGQRRSEVAGMRWEDLDLQAKTWAIGADRNKGGRAHIVPLSQPALDIIVSAPRKTIQVGNRMQSSPYVFTSDGKAAISGFSKAKDTLDRKIKKARDAAEADGMPDWSIHDLRRTAATEMGRLGTPEFIISKVLNHAAKGVTGQVYNRYEYLAEKRHALDAWAAYVERLVSPEGGNVVVLRA